MTKKKYFQLSEQQRYQIESLKKAGHSNIAIAIQLGRHKSTIGRELRRNATLQLKYDAKEANELAIDRHQLKLKVLKFLPQLKNYVKEKLCNEQWSPEQISGFCKVNDINMMSHESIYSYIYKDMKQGGNLFKHLRTQHKKRKNRTHKKDKRGQIIGRVSIHQRPVEVTLKKRIGDWEADLIEGVNHSSFALTMVERKSQFMLMAALPNKNAASVQNKMINLLAPYKQAVHTITTDNGKEFANHKIVAQKLNTACFFADPYSSWQRGINEYTNKLIRQYIPKKTNIKNYTPQQINDVVNKLNSRPRKLLNFKTPLNVFLTTFNSS